MAFQQVPYRGALSSGSVQGDPGDELLKPFLVVEHVHKARPTSWVCNCCSHFEKSAGGMSMYLVMYTDMCMYVCLYVFMHFE